MTFLDDAVNALAGDADNTSSALRKLLVVGSRMGAENMVNWCTKELNGYADDDEDEYPPHRRRLPTLVVVRWTGYMGSIYDHPLEANLVPVDLRGWFHYSYSEPIVELEALAEGGERYWPLRLVQRLRRLADERKVPIVEDCKIYSVKQVITTTQVQGIIGNIRNRALMMALELQQAFPTAGEPGGPTVKDEGVMPVVNNIYNTILWGGTNSLVMGENNTQNVH